MLRLSLAAINTCPVSPDMFLVTQGCCVTSPNGFINDAVLLNRGTMHPKRLAITISGAVSLGSYEAGVLYEVITAITAHNKAIPVDHPEERIEIDVLTGASAGGMTAAIAGQLLIGKLLSKWAPDDNPFYNAWVKRIDLSGLAKMREGEDPMKSLLSSDCVEEVANEFLPGTFAVGMRHPAAPVKGDIWLGLALSNLTGVDYAAKALNQTEFIYTSYQDRLVRKIAGTAENASWNEIRAAALACGAFPVAFRVRELLRNIEDYFCDKNGTTWSRRFLYTDGGVFDNQPLGLARDLVSRIDLPGENDRRFYLFVSPWPKSSSVSELPLQAKDATFFATAQALVSAVFNQGRFQDWVKAESVNRDLGLLNARAAQLAELLLSNVQLVNVLGPAAKLLADEFVKALPAGEDVITLDLERSRLRKEFEFLGDKQTDYPRLLDAFSPNAKNAWLDALLVLEYAAQLRDKAEMVIYDVTADDKELAGWQISAFAGFFDERFRQHDYEVGRQKAKNWLIGLNVSGMGSGQSLGPINYTPDGVPLPTASSLAVRNLQLEDMPKGPRRLLRDLVMQRVERLIDENVEAWVVGPPVRAYLKSMIKGIVGRKLGL